MEITDYILLSLKDGHKYGLEIVDYILKSSNGQINVKQATLYGLLKKLEQKNLIDSYWKDSEIGGKRHYYLITESGEKYIDEHCPSTTLSHSTKVERTNDEQANNSIAFYQNQTKSSASFWKNADTELAINFNSFKEQETKKEEFEHPQDEIEEKNDSTILQNNERYEQKDFINPMQNEKKIAVNSSEIDYKSILGELYCADEQINEIKQPTTILNNTKQIDAVSTTNKPIIEEVIPSAKNDISEKYIPDNSKKIIPMDFSNFGIIVKKHNKYNVNSSSNMDYVKINKLNFLTSIINYLIFVLLSFTSYSIINVNLAPGTSYLHAFIIFTALGAICPIIYTIIFLIIPNKKRKNEFNFKEKFYLSLMIAIVGIIFVLSLNFLFGMTSISQLKYICYWLFPTIIAVSIVIYICVKAILLKTNKFYL